MSEEEEKKEKRQKSYIFDFDHTLFNARDFRQKLGLILEGDPEIESEKIWQAFERGDAKLIDFILSESSNFVFNGVSDALSRLRARKILLTYGSLDFQRLKVQASGLQELFDELYFTEESKILFLQNFFEKERNPKNFVFVNDNYNKRFSENKEVKNTFSEIEVFEVDNYTGDESVFISTFLKRALREQEERENLQKSSSLSLKNNFGKLK